MEGEGGGSINRTDDPLDLPWEMHLLKIVDQTKEDFVKGRKCVGEAVTPSAFISVWDFQRSVLSSKGCILNSTCLCKFELSLSYNANMLPIKILR